MTVAYILEQGAYLVKEGERILVKKEKNVLHTLHAFKLEQIVLFGNVSITPPVISYLLKLGIDTVFMSKNGRYKGRLQGPYSKNINLRQIQFKKLSEPDFCFNTARYIVKGKIRNMRALLLRINRTKDHASLEDHIFTLKRMLDKLDSAKDIDEIRGIEGKASAIYFDGFSKGFISKTINFTKRIRRPPTDPVNSLLSLGYTFLFNELMGAVSMVGLDPYLGALHTLEYGKPSLPLDLMEEWRPVVIDTLILSIFNMNILSELDFRVAQSDQVLQEEDDESLEPIFLQTSKPLPVKLTAQGLKKFIAQYERKIRQKIKYHITNVNLTYRDCIREQIRHFVRYLKGDDPEYVPLPLR
jgi:CRISPR-associated protein Cas1